MTVRTHVLGPSGVAVPVIGIGTWQMEGDDRKDCIAAIRKSLDAGATHVDTAELYGSGKVEEIVGEAIAGRRDEVFLVSKVLPSNASYEGTLKACERSLKRLRTERLDLYLLHWPGNHPLDETVRAFERLVADGKTLAWGVSNFDVRELEETLAIAGAGKIAANQVLYHLQERAIEHAVVPWCEAHGVAVVGYSPFGSGSWRAERGAAGQVLAAVAKKHGATPRQVALAFLVRRPSLFAIPKSCSATRVQQNVAAADVTLDATDIDALDRAFPVGPHRGLPSI
jgi:diketogulonate reductase-like aldo/keto reductase